MKYLVFKISELYSRLGDAAYPQHRYQNNISCSVRLKVLCFYFPFCLPNIDQLFSFFSWILTPFRDTGNLSEPQKRYNNIHSVTRQTIERAFGLLKSKWRRLRFLDMTKLENVPMVITAACTLHNVCIEVRPH